MPDSYGSTLYPKEFVERLPRLRQHETRPLLMLLRGQHENAAGEIERIERWFRELDGPADRKAVLAGNLRGLRAIQFWSGLYELLTSRIFVERGWRARYEVPIAGLTPDFTVPYTGGDHFVAEVLTAFEEREYSREDDDLHYVANALDTIRRRTGVFIEEVHLPKTRPSLKRLRQSVAAWLDTCPADGARLSLSDDQVGLSIVLSSVSTRSEDSPIVEGIVGPGGKISTYATIRDALRGKSAKYGSVKATGVPLVIFVWEGAWTHVTHTSLEWALWGRDRLRFSRTPKGIGDAVWDREPGGLFGFGPNGKSDPQHTRISAVMYCVRVCNKGNISAGLRLYHHPHAANPLPLKVFEGIAQCVPVEVTPNRVSAQWDRQPGTSMLLR